jgi:hypothetical protein
VSNLWKSRKSIETEKPVGKLGKFFVGREIYPALLQVDSRQKGRLIMAKFVERKIDLRRLKCWFGAPPLFPGESEGAFDDFVLQFADCMNPEDRLVETLVYRYAIETWKQMGLMSFQALAARRLDEAREKFSKRHADNLDERRRSRDRTPGFIEDMKNENRAEFTAAVLHEKPLDTLQECVVSTHEVEDAIAFEKRLATYERIDFLIDQSTKRSSMLLQQIEWYRFALAEGLRKKHQQNVEMLTREASGKHNGPLLVPAEKYES